MMYVLIDALNGEWCQESHWCGINIRGLLSGCGDVFSHGSAASYRREPNPPSEGDEWLLLYEVCPDCHYGTLYWYHSKVGWVRGTSPYRLRCPYSYKSIYGTLKLLGWALLRCNILSLWLLYELNEFTPTSSWGDFGVVSRQYILCWKIGSYALS